MKGSSLLLISLCAGLALYGLWAAPAPNSGVCTAPLKLQNLHLQKTAHPLLADRIETKNSIIYTTDPNLDRARKRDQEEEREKEYYSWKMLQNMLLYPPAPQKPRPPRRGKPPSP